MKLIRGRLVLIEWVDSNGIGGVFWKDVDSIPADPKPVHVLSVGWIFAVSAEGVMLVPHFHPEEFGGELVIPRCAIVSVKPLRGPSAL